MKRVLLLVVGLFPAGAVKNWLLRLMGHDVARSARISPNLIIGNVRLEIGEGARIGAFNVLRNVRLLRLGDYAELAQFNWVTSAPFLTDGSPVPHAGNLIIGDHASVTSRHYFDVPGGILIGEYTTVAGVRSVFLTHNINAMDSVLDTSTIQIGVRSMVGGSCQVLPGAVVPDECVVAMGSVIARGLVDRRMLYAGVPAKAKKPLPEGAYFHRSVGVVRPRWEVAPTLPATPNP